jgi:adenosylcobinamide-phosphate synthase
MFAALAFTALIIEGLAGYPQPLLGAIGHPVTWIGALIAWCEDAWNHPRLSFARRRFNGVAALALVVLVALAVAFALERLAGLLPGLAGLILTGLAASTLIAQRSLYEHVGAVASALETGGVEDGRRAVQNIVGRETANLDEAAVSRAAIESLAENFSDGVVAPLFWMVVGGLPGAAAYKAVNTADSMVGHKSKRFAAFGWASARFDDLLNLPASRLASVWIVAATGFLYGTAAARTSWTVLLRDRAQHRSPNAGWPEAAMAGALGLKLGGPRIYEGMFVNDHWLGDGREEATAADIRRALDIYRAACAIEAAVIAVLAGLIFVL